MNFFLRLFYFMKNQSRTFHCATEHFQFLNNLFLFSDLSQFSMGFYFMDYCSSLLNPENYKIITLYSLIYSMTLGQAQDRQWCQRLKAVGSFSRDWMTTTKSSPFLPMCTAQLFFPSCLGVAMCLSPIACGRKSCVTLAVLAHNTSFPFFKVNMYRNWLSYDKI